MWVAVFFSFWIVLRNHFPSLNAPRSGGEIHTDFIKFARIHFKRLGILLFLDL